MTERFEGSVLVAIPVFGAPELTEALLTDLLNDPGDQVSAARIVVVDNGGDYEPERVDPRLTVVRPGRNLRWIGTTNWALDAAARAGDAVCVVLNNDIRLSPGFLTGLLRPFALASDVAMVAACYDDFWLHQRASDIPSSAAHYVAREHERDVPFCDGTALGFAMSAVAEIGGLDQQAFPRHGYGSDIDFALRARAAGWRCQVTERAYVAHRRKGTIDRVPGESSERNRAEILTGLDAVWGDRWRPLAGLSSAAFTPHNQGSEQSWYA